MKLLCKIHITGILTLETGLHIGGSEAELEIGGIDSPVVKDAMTRLPYIPGSSLKGKLRSLIGKNKGYKNIWDDKLETLVLFGEGAGSKTRMDTRGNLIVRDAFLKAEDKKTLFEDKAENVIRRSTGGATPRHIERVTAGAKFEVDMILDIYEEYSPERLLETLKVGFALLENDYLGGSGTRGYGKISLEMNAPVKLTFKGNGTVEREIMTHINLNQESVDNEVPEAPEE